MILGTANKIKAMVQGCYKTLEEIESESAQLRKSIEAFEAAKAHNHAIATKRASLESEREDLKLEYANASFEDGDVEAIHERRREIDSALESLRPVDVPELDTFAIEDARYRAEHTTFASVEELVSMIRDELQELRTTHHDRKRLAVVGFDKYTTTADENAVKKSHRPGWKSGEELRAEREAREREENIRKYGTATPNFSSTDAMTKALWNAKAKRERVEDAV
jgi:glutamate synthase domain-containing protein 2